MKQFFILILILSFSSCDFDNNLLGSNPDIDDDHRPILGNESLTAPKIISPVADSFIANPTTISGSCFPASSIEITHGDLVTNPSIVECSLNGDFTTSLQFAPGIDGTKDLSLIQKDPTGKESPAITHSLNLDTTPPATPSAPTNPTAGSNQNKNINFTATGQCTPGDTVSVANPNLVNNPTQQVCDASGNYSIDAEFKDNSDGIQEVMLTYTDPAGNTSSPFSMTLVVDSTAPGAPVIATPSSNSSVPGNPTTFNITGTCSPGDNLKITNSSIVGSPVSTACAGSGTFSQALTFTATATNGNQTLIVTAQDTALNESAPSNRVVILDSITPPAPAAPTSPSANTRINSPEAITGNCTNGETITITEASMNPNPASATCTNGSYTINVTFSSDGAKALGITATDGANNTSASTTHNIISDNTPPGILAQPTSPVLGSNISNPFTLTGNCETDAIVEISNSSLATNPLRVTCTAGSFSTNINLSNPTDGGQTFILKQTDQAGNTSPNLNAVYTLDTQAPSAPMATTPIASSRVAKSFTLNGTCEANSSVSITSPNLTAAANFNCSNSGTFSQALVFNAAVNANQTLSLSATDAAGNSSVSSTHILFVDDVNPTAATITSPAAASTVGINETLTGTCTSGDKISISGTYLTPAVETLCASNSFSIAVSFQAGVASSAETLTLTTEDQVGNTSTNTHNLTVNTAASQAPSITAPSNGAPVNLAVMTSGGCSGPTFTVRVYNPNLTPNPTTVVCSGANNFAVTVNFNPGTVGPQPLEFAQELTAGGVESNREIVGVNVDTTAPNAPIITSHNNNDFVRASMNLEGSCAPNDTISIANANLGTNPTTGTCSAGGSFNIPITWSTGNGSLQTLNVTDIDPAGNISPIASVNLNIDLSIPIAVTIVSPQAAQSVGASTTIEGACEADATISISSADLSVNPTTTTCDSSGEYSTALDFLAASDGNTPTLSVTQRDKAGNTSPAQTVSVTINSSPPTGVTITAPTAGSTVDNTIAVTGACVTNSVVRVKNDFISANPTTAVCISSAYSINITFTKTDGTIDGAQVIRVDQVDSVGNISTETSVVVSLDTQAPTKPVLPSAPLVAAAVADPVQVTGLCTGNETLIFSASDLNPTEQTTTCSSGTYSINLDWNNAATDGNKTVEIKARDSVNNTSEAIDYEVVLDTTAPIAVLPTNPAPGTSVPLSPKSVEVTGQCAQGDKVIFTGGAINPSPAQTVCDANGMYKIPLVYTVVGSQSLTLTMQDPAGNTSAGATYTLIVDNTPPADPVLISLNPQNATSSTEAPKALWTNPTDTDLENIEYSIGTSAGSENVFNWKNLGLATEHTETAVNFSECAAASPKYFINLRASDKAGNRSGVESSSAFYFDSVAPTNPGGISITTSANSTSSATISWSASSEACEFSHYEIAVSTSTNESDIIANASWTNVGNVLTGNITGLNLDAGQTYYMLIKAVDVSGNESGVSSSQAWSTSPTMVLTSTATTVSTNLNTTSLTPMSWVQESLNTDFFNFSSSNPSRIIIRESGKYSVNYSIPVVTTSNCQRCQIMTLLYKNGSPINYAATATSYIRGQNNHTESSIHFSSVFEFNANDEIDIRVIAQAATGTMITSGAVLFIEKNGNSINDFLATGSRTVNSTNLNGAASGMQWSSSFKGSFYTHNNSANSHQVTLNDNGAYYVSYNIPIQAATTNSRMNIKAFLTLNGTTIAETAATQGYMRNESGHDSSSVHYSGIITGITANDILELRVEQEANSGTINILNSKLASLYLKKVDIATNTIILKSTATQISSDLNASAIGAPLRFTNQPTNDPTVFTHSTATNSQNITVLKDGAYEVIYNDFLDVNSARSNVKIVLKRNGVPIPGAECATHYARLFDGSDKSSCSFQTLINGVKASDIITIDASSEANSGNTVVEEDATLILIKK